MNNAWQLQDAKSRFSELVETAVKEGPQIVTRRGVETVVVISVKDLKKLRNPGGSLVSFFQSAPRAELDIKRSKSMDRDVSL